MVKSQKCHPTIIRILVLDISTPIKSLLFGKHSTTNNYVFIYCIRPRVPIPCNFHHHLSIQISSSIPLCTLKPTKPHHSVPIQCMSNALEYYMRCRMPHMATIPHSSSSGVICHICISHATTHHSSS